VLKKVSAQQSSTGSFMRTPLVELQKVAAVFGTKTLMWSHSQVTESGSHRPIRTLMRTAIGVAEGGSSSQPETLMRNLVELQKAASIHTPEP
jgi:hypothetical protein